MFTIIWLLLPLKKEVGQTQFKRNWARGMFSHHSDPQILVHSHRLTKMSLISHAKLPSNIIKHTTINANNDSNNNNNKHVFTPIITQAKIRLASIYLCLISVENLQTGL